MSQNRLNQSEKQLWTTDGSLGLNLEYSGEYSLGSASGLAWRRLMRLDAAQIWRACSSVVFFLGARRLRVGYSDTISGGACVLPLAPMKLIFAPVSLYRWTLHCGMIKTCFWQLWKFKCIPTTPLFSDERGSDINCWWEKPLVVALKHSEGIKHTVLFQQQKAYKNKQKLLIHALCFLSSISLLSLPHTDNGINLVAYLYTN
jgi:hypothetical protein